ncbi:origin recognition complex subunit 3 [Plutella xylostella]|uniref:origin recognition complex subunit 3 n=1 Tax=Plutella xylostella TaxID=51655 RepID=UPI0020327DC8|nr:origin recognition complex subunit 3 [Plutella xylostella]
MEATVSVSKGVFLFKNGWKKTKQRSKTATLFESKFINEPWYSIFKSNWNTIENEIQDLNRKTYSMLLNDIVSYVKSFSKSRESCELDDGIIPSATLLTGVNQPDHVSQFEALLNKIREDVTPHIAMVNSQDAPTVKHLIENSVWQLIHGHATADYEDEDLDESINNITKGKKLKKSHCTMTTLKKWYHELYYNNMNLSPKKKRKSHSTKSLVVVIPDFESFNCNVLQDFVMIISSYISSLPIVFIFGVATSVSALHKSFPYHVSSKLLIKVFHSHSSPVYMNQVLEDIFLTHSSPFHVSGRALELLTDVFLFYDFSVTGLIQSVKYCMMEHYYGDNMKSLCCKREEIDDTVFVLTAEDLENIRHLPSFRPFLESQDCRARISLFEDDNFLRDTLCEQLNRLHDYLYSFYTCLRLFSAFVKDLPKNVLGKSVREMYKKCAAECITETAGFKECMQLLNFQSQVKLVESIKGALKVINTALQNDPPVVPLRMTPSKNNLVKEDALVLNESLGTNFLKSVRVHLTIFLRNVQNASTEATVTVNDADENEDVEMVTTPGNRYKLKEKLLKATQREKIPSEYEMIRSRLVNYLEKVFHKGLQPPHTQPFHEIFFFSDVASVKKQIVGSPRGAVHTALSNPEHYLQCNCCHLPTIDSTTSTLPDISLVYKLHRECGKHINLYDWLQAFASVVEPTVDDEERRTVDPHIQVRFTRAVAELQFLGFIKTSKRKTDHVMRLTW